MKQKPIFRGAATALITPFADGKPDKTAFAALVRAQCEAGISALVVCGTTGEAAVLSYREQSMLAALAKEHAVPDIPVIAGCGSPSTEKAVKLAKNAVRAGADALLCVTPYYNKCTEEGLYRHYMTVADAAGIPVILYEVPGRTGVSVSPKLYGRLAKHECIRAVKDASGNLTHTAQILYETEGVLDVYAGDDALTIPTLSLGGCGVISVLAN
ncbi:MAG: 4-hydroxy-tetrahydrodipicolinate synthase, partial [Clostridia bacterium]|nr:4-hydroxy-tetrahydrodipicolinate synthase [Clostridia bacterium]